MRTTLTLDDEAYATVAAVAHTSGKRIGEVVSEIIRKHFAPAEELEFVPPTPDFPFYTFPDTGQKSMPYEDVQRLIDDEGIEEHFELMRHLETLRHQSPPGPVAP